MKKSVLKILQNSQENTGARVYFLVMLQYSVYHFIKNETQAKVFSCEFCEIFKNNIFTIPPVVTPVGLKMAYQKVYEIL